MRKSRIFLISMFILLILLIPSFSSSSGEKKYIVLVANNVSLTHACSYYKIYSKDIKKDLKTFEISKVKEVVGKLKEIWIDVLTNESYEIEVPDYGNCTGYIPLENLTIVNLTNSSQTCEDFGYSTYNKTHCSYTYRCILGYHTEERYRKVWKTYKKYGVEKEEIKMKEEKDFEKEKFPKVEDWYDVRVCGVYDFEKGLSGWEVALDHIPSYQGVEYSNLTWWNTTFQYRKPITITEQSGNTLTDYQVRLEIDTATLISEGKMNEDCSDVRFTYENSTGEYEIPYWIESGCNSANTIIWIKVPEIPANGETTIYMYYGNPSATSESNGDAVFEFFDDFEGTSLDTNKWAIQRRETSGGSATLEDGSLILSAPSSTEPILIESLVDIQINNYILETKGKVLDDYGREQYRPGIIWKHIRGSYDNFYAWDTYAFGHDAWVLFRLKAGSFTNLGEVSGADINPNDAYSGEFHLKVIVNGNTYTAMEVLRNKTVTATDSQLTGSSVGLLAEKCVNKYYFFLVRKFADPEPTYEIGSEETSNQPPSVTLNYPADQSTNTSLTIEFGFTPTDDSGFSNCSLWTNETGTFSLTETNSSPIVNGSINTITHSFTQDGTYIWNVKCFDDAGLSAFAPQNYTLTIDSIKISNIRWSTTAGDTDSQLDFYSYLDYINVTVTSAYTDKVLLTLINPDGEVILNNVTMTNYTQSDYTYDLEYLLYKAGTYTINIYANITNGYTEKATATFDVVRIVRALGLIYGFDTKKIPTTTEIDDLINNYDYNLLEIKYNKSQINTVWSSILDTISYVKNKNAMVALTARLDGDYTSETYKNNLKSAIMTYYPDLTNEPYLSGTAFLQIELVNVSDYTESYLASFVNNVSQWIINATNNNFLIYVKNFNSTLLDTSYVEPNPIPYLNQANKVDLINNETYYLRRGILNRIYDLPTDDLKSWAKFNHENVILNLKGEINTSSTLDKNIVELTNNYLIVYNNYSSDHTFSISYPAVSGKDAYDLINDTIIELDTDGTISITLKPYNVSYIAFEDLDYIKYTDKPHIYRATREDLEISYTDGTLDSNWDLTGDNDIMIKLSDGSTKTADFMVYYGWINASGITDWSKYELAILADKNAEELANVESQTDVYGYMSMADYNDSVEWENEKIQEMEEWKNLGAVGVFLNGIDIGAESGYPNFVERFKRIIDYAHRNLSMKVILNTYTFFSKYCTWGDYCMKESFCARWDCPTGYTYLGSLPNGTAICCSDSSCTSYTSVQYSWEDFDIDRQRIEWYKSHGVRVLAMSFGEENDESKEQYCYHMAKIFNLPYYYSQPNFQFAHVDEFPDFGTTTQYDFNQNNDYYSRLYTRGLVWINSTAKTYGFESYRNIESEQVCAYLYDNDDTTEDGVSVMVNDDSQVYTIDDSDLPAGSWEWKCFSIDQSDYSPTYYVKMWYSSRPSSVPIYIGNDVVEGTGVNSWWDTSSENPPLSTSSVWNAYEADRNWMIKLIVNATYKGSIDTVTKIERSKVVDTSKGENVTVNISSEVHYPLPFIDKGENLTKYTSYMVRINFNGTWYNITPEITEDCDTDNPTWSEFTIGSTTYYSCAKDYGSKIYLRVKLPHLSTTQIEYSSTDTTGPEIDFVSQTPSDLSSLNILGKYLNITYNITDPAGIDTVNLYHKTNSSTSEIVWYINGTAYSGWQIAENYTNSSSIWYFYLDHQIYPGTYNLPDSVMRDTPKEHFSLDNKNEILKIRFFNVSNDKEFNYLVLDTQNQTTSTEFLRIYYCNESYSTGNPENSPYCVEFYDLEPTTPHNYTRDSSLYWIIPLPINKSTGYLANVYVTPTSYILLRDSASAGGWNISYVTNISRPDTVQYSNNNGGSYSNFAGTVDMHIHQFSGSDSLWYYVCANDTFGNSNCSEIRQDLIQIDNLPPSSPDIYNPTEGYYRGLITINYTQSISPNAYPIVNYTIDLVDLDKNFVQKIADNDLKLSYVWNSSEAPDGKYFIRVRACDNLTQCSYGYSENITIDNTKPIVTITSPTNTTYTTNTITLSYTVTDTNLNRVWYSLNDGTNVTITGSTILILDNGNYKLTLMQMTRLETKTAQQFISRLAL